MFNKLFNEVEAIREAFPEFGFLEALTYIKIHADEYDKDVRIELTKFMSAGADFFAEV